MTNDLVGCKESVTVSNYVYEIYFEFITKSHENAEIFYLRHGALTNPTSNALHANFTKLENVLKKLKQKTSCQQV